MSKIKQITNVITAKVMEVIHVQSRLGEGVEDDPVRWIDEYYSLDGKLLARVDSCASLLTLEVEK